MSRSKRDAELASILGNFCEKIILLNQQADEYLSNYSKERKQNDEKITNIQEVLANLKADGDVSESRSLSVLEYEVYSLQKERSKAHDLVRMHFNAQFLYMFTLFEKFLSETVKSSVRKHKNIKEEYTKQFVEFATEQHSKYGNKRYIPMLPDIKKLLENYDELRNHIRIACKIFKIQTNDKIFRQHWRQYIEARERRNLLTHRGNYLDNRYFSSIKNGLGKDGQKFIKFLNDEVLKYYGEKIDFSKSRSLKVDEKKIPADVIPIYLRKITLTLLYLAHIIHMEAFKKSKKHYQTKGSYFINSGHSLLLHSYDQDSINFALIFREILIYYENYICGNALNNWFLIEKVNFCLLYKFIIEHMNKRVKQYNMSNEKKLDELPMIDFESVLSECNAEDNDLREIALAHFRRDKKNLIKYSKKAKLTKREFDDWFLFREWQSDADVKAFFEKVADKKS